MQLDGVDLRKFGSAGQVRAAMVALKLAKLCLLREERDECSLFLMDDFDTDLDEARAAALAAFRALAPTPKERRVHFACGFSPELHAAAGRAAADAIVRILPRHLRPGGGPGSIPPATAPQAPTP